MVCMYVYNIVPHTL